METRIRRNIILLVAATFLIIIGMCAGWFFALVRPQREQIAQVEKDYGQYKDAAAKLDANLKDKQKAEDQLEYLQGQLEFFRGGQTDRNALGLYRRLYFGEVVGESDANIAARDIAWHSWLNEYHYQFGPALIAELQSAADQAQVTLAMPVVKVDDPPQIPEDVVKRLPNNGFMRPLSATNNGTLKLQINGTFEGIVRFFNVINHSSILMVVDKDLKLEGSTPSIKATFSLTPYLVASGPGTKLSSSSTSAGGDDAGGATPSGPPKLSGDATAAPADSGKTKQSLEPEIRITTPRRQAELSRPAF